VVWQAKLSLGFEQQADRTILRHRWHQGPLRVQKALWPEAKGVCHVIIVHPPAGFAGGDALSIEVKLAQGSHALLTTPGAGKWYASAGKTAQQNIQLEVANDAILEWLPQETMLFDQAIGHSQTSIKLDAGAVFIGWDILVIGRQSRQEKFEQGQYHNQLNIWQGDQLLLKDQLCIEGNDRWLYSPLGMNGCAITANFYAVAPLASRSETQLDQLIDQLRELVTRMKAPIGLTRFNGVVVARYLGNDTRQCLDGFAGLRAKCRREWFGLDEELPRIWKT
jgi:urease accessory protein